MGTTTSNTTDSLRDQFDTVVISRNSKSGKRLHIPSGDGPLCDTQLGSSREWTRKPVDAYPPGWHKWCSRCKERLNEEDEKPTIGNALSSEW